MKKYLFDLLKESAYKQLEIQFSSIENVENKTGVLLAIIFGIPTALVTFTTTKTIVLQWNDLLTIGSVCLGFAAVFSIKSLLCRNFSLPADVEIFLAENKKLKNAKIRVNFIDDCCKSINKNVKRLKIKGRDFNYSLVIFTLAIFLFIIGIMKRG